MSRSINIGGSGSSSYVANGNIRIHKHGAESRHRAKVVVVGAGIAGVTAAAKLVQNGIKDVVVLEAQDYVGGRIKDHMVGDIKLDMGAMFVHGEVGNPIYEIVRRLGIEVRDLDDVPTFAYSPRGEKIPYEEIDGLLDLLEENKTKLPATVGQNRREVVTKLYNQFLSDNHVSSSHPKRELYDAVFQYFCFYECVGESSSSLSDVSAWMDEKYVICGGKSELVIKGGYSTVVRSLLQLIPQEIIRTETPVQTIDWNNLEDEGILVKCENGDIIAADHVIVTISLGCLKAVHGSMFSPALPVNLVKSMDKVKFGCVGKVFLRWDTPFWSNEGVNYDFMWLKTHPVNLIKDTSRQKTGNGKPWWEGLNGCHSVPGCDGVLLFWLLENQMEAIKDLDDQEIMSVLHELMQKFIGDVDVPMPQTMYRSTWEHNPYTRGTYSHSVPSFDSNDLQHTHRPVFPSKENPRLLFAGEAFSIEFITTVHGSFITGEQQADTVLKANGITDSIRVVDAISNPLNIS